MLASRVPAQPSRVVYNERAVPFFLFWSVHVCRGPRSVLTIRRRFVLDRRLLRRICRLNIAFPSLICEGTAHGALYTVLLISRVAMQVRTSFRGAFFRHFIRRVTFLVSRSHQSIAPRVLCHQPMVVLAMSC